MMTITPITPQQLLDYAWQRFGLHPELRATMPNSDSCQYRVPDPYDPRGYRGCVIGDPMPPELYDPAMDKIIVIDLDEPRWDANTDQMVSVIELDPTIDNVKQHFPRVGEWLNLCPAEMLTELQTAHDFMLKRGTDEYRQEVQLIAKRWSLIDPTQ
jgi:hypothetical protein